MKAGTFELTGWPVARWKYPEAFVTQVIARFDLGSETPDLLELEHWLNAQFGRPSENKVVFAMQTPSASTYYLMFYDGEMLVGTGVRPYCGDHLPGPLNLPA
jgi:hypothetical protein